MESATVSAFAAREAARPKTASLPWYCVVAALGATCIPIGALWDISWHSTIGRDTFWTPAHMMIHLGGLLPGFTAGYLVFKTSFWGTDQEKNSAVRLWGFHGPLGAWVIIWGALAMLFSAPFDNWWHEAYGLDVEILSPPHTVLAAGMYAVAVGSMMLVLAYQNRSGDGRARLLFIHTAGVLLAMSTIIVTDMSYPNAQHQSLFYKVSCAIYPLYLVAAARASRTPWAATGTAAVYMAILLLMVWALPLFKAQPMLAPIYNPIDRMAPPSFPLLLVVPAFVIDLVLLYFNRKTGFWWDSLAAIVIGAAFLGTFFVVQYNFSKFLISPAADNWFFAGGRWLPYFIRPGDFLHEFWRPGRDPLTLSAMMVALTLAIVKSRIALSFGNWMSKVQR